MFENASTVDRPPAQRNRTPARAAHTGALTAGQAGQRSRTTNSPLKRVNRKTAQGRRVADLFGAYLAALGNPQDAITQANALTAAELKTAAEDARKALLDGKGDGDQLVRLENLAFRAERKLGLKGAVTAKTPTLAEYRPPGRLGGRFVFAGRSVAVSQHQIRDAGTVGLIALLTSADQDQPLGNHYWSRPNRCPNRCPNR